MKRGLYRRFNSVRRVRASIRIVPHRPRLKDLCLPGTSTRESDYRPGKPVHVIVEPPAIEIRARCNLGEVVRWVEIKRSTNDSAEIATLRPIPLVDNAVREMILFGPRANEHGGGVPGFSSSKACPPKRAAVYGLGPNHLAMPHTFYTRPEIGCRRLHGRERLRDQLVRVPPVSEGTASPQLVPLQQRNG
jgi:hypothetical protein